MNDSMCGTFGHLAYFPNKVHDIITFKMVLSHNGYVTNMVVFVL